MAISLATRRQFTIGDYRRMREAQILTEDDRVELIDGQIIVMSPIGPFHVGLVIKLTQLLSAALGNTGLVSVQNPIELNQFGEPQPDIAVLRPRDDVYTTALATPEDVLLLIEVSDSSLAYDRDQKLPQYAAAGITEVWLVDAQKLIIEQYTHPFDDQYTQLVKVVRGHRITATTIPILSFTTDQIF
ncbi:MAG: Uma2 family endonuclease [Roseiflexaceae bacterium]|nr:Uma2 family endonuclease [Roseiflexaceae bacterium]